MKKLFINFLIILLILLEPIGVLAEGQSIIKLTVIAPQTIKIGEGGACKVGVEIYNNSNIAVKRLTARAFIENPDKAYIVGDGIIFENDSSMPSNGSKTGSFNLSTDADFTSKTVAIKIKLNYYIENTNERIEQEETIYVKVEAPEKPEKPVNPAIEISKVEAGWPGGVDAGKTFQVPFEVKNTGDAPAKNIKCSLEGLEPGGITLAEGLSTKDITVLNPGQSQFIIYNLKTDKTAQTASKLLTLKYYFNGETAVEKDQQKGSSAESTSPKEGSYQFSIDINKMKTEDSNVVFEDVSFPSGPIGRNQTTGISFILANKGKDTIKKVVVTANSQDQQGLASKSLSTIKAKDLKAGEKRKFSFDFITTPAAETKNYPVELKVSFVNEKTEETGEISQMAGVFVKAPKEKDPNEKKELSVPKLIIEEYSFNPEIIEAGKAFNMYLTFYNTNTKKAVKNIKIYLTSDTQESATSGGASQDGKQGDSSSQGPTPSASVFTPKGTSNTFYIDSIKPGARVEKEITLTTVPDTAAKTYTVVANFEYEDSDANKYTATEQIGIPVVQEAKLQVGEIVPQGDFMVGMEVPVSVDFYNVGKAQLYNVMVKASGDGLTMDTPTYYKGNFAPGASDNFTLNVNAQSEGNKKLKLEFSYEDSTGNIKIIERELEFKVENMDMGMDNQEDLDAKSESPLWKKILIIIIIMALISGATIFFIKKFKKKKQEDEDLKI